MLIFLFDFINGLFVFRRVAEPEAKTDILTESKTYLNGVRVSIFKNYKSWNSYFKLIKI